MFARYCRITEDEARAIRDDCGRREAAAVPEAHDSGAFGPFPGDAVRARWREVMEAMRPRWKTEAEACIAHHSLRVFGDEWKRE